MTDYIVQQRTDFDKGQVLPELELDMSDSELKGLIKKWKGISAESETVLLNNAKINKDYYIGNDRRIEEILDDKSKVTDNRIFTNVETIVPIVTASPAKPIVFIPSAQGKNEAKKKKIRDQSIKVQKILLGIYEDQKIQHKFEKLIRQHQIHRLGIVKYGISDDRVYADVVLPSRILIDSEATTIEESEFIGEKIVDTASNLVKKYPDKESEIKQEAVKMGTKITYIEWWTDDMLVVSISDRVILEKKKNPLFDYEGTKKQKYDEFGKKIEGEPTKHNFFERPKKPYIFFNVYNLGESILDDVTPLELSKTLQDDINDRKRQIADNTEVAGNPIRAYRGLSQDEAESANSDLRAGDGAQLSDDQDIFYVQAAALPAFVQNDLQDSRNSIDNIFGIHSTTRGERLSGAGESGRAREALREGDEDRQAVIGRAIESLSEELYNAFAHLVKVFYDKDQTLPILGKDGSEEYVEFKRDDIAEGMKIRVKPGSTIPEDKNALKAQAIELLQLDAIPKRRAFEMIGIEDAEEYAKELEQEGIKAKLEQEKLIEKEQKELAKTETAKNFEEQISQMG